jgi:hypothetical protein
MADGRDDEAAANADSDARSSSALSALPSALRTWPRLYAAVLIVLALDIALFYAFTRAFQ